MDREEIRALEPKYTNNERHLTEGEAAEIKAEEERRGDGEFPLEASLLPLVPLAVFARSGIDSPNGIKPN
ncbi:hypothetical protein [Paenibacillus contaminans]|uniref:Uncharacterized protein n=1 Tax=Paenibacillus contaminans TaxID=450362 RepID=A0A329MFA0_9BACL|nr:hypothetical protein [Paenibacillus contaminans]RAV18635.1 hypothetical protein DQG23_25385 [Paenibacillus contaminans]